MRIMYVVGNIVLCMAFLVLPCKAQNVSHDRSIRFQAADVFMDSGNESLAAYQVEIRYNKKRVKIVGLEGGETGFFEEPPYYDPRGMVQGRIILASFTTEDAKAPKGKGRVARLHLQILGSESPVLTIRLMAAAKPGAERIHSKPSIVLVNNIDSAAKGNH